MKVYPAIELKNKRCVIWQNGHYHNFDRHYHAPEAAAANCEAAGSDLIHIFDIDGSVIGHPLNNEVIKRITEAVSVPIQLSGGICSIQNIEQILNLGVSKVSIGQQALINPSFVKDAVNTFGSKHISVMIQAENGIIISNKNNFYKNYNVLAFILMMKEYGVHSIIYSDTIYNGLQQIPNMEHIKEIVSITDMDISVTGGICSLKDLERLNEANVTSAIIGQALYTNKIDLKEAIELFDKGGLV